MSETGGFNTHGNADFHADLDDVETVEFVITIQTFVPHELLLWSPFTYCFELLLLDEPYLSRNMRFVNINRI
ncbi:hypothetical protein YC2023_084697 [Brassica napus]